MPRYTIIQQPNQNQAINPNISSSPKNKQMFHRELVRMLKKNPHINQHKNHSQPLTHNDQHYKRQKVPQKRYIIAEESDNEQNLNETRVYLPKIKRKNKVAHAASYDAMDNEKELLKKFMNAKLVFIKKPTIQDANQKKHKRMHTLDYSHYSPQKNQQNSYKIIKTPTNSPKRYIIKQSDPDGNTKVYQLHEEFRQQRQHRRKKPSYSNPQFSTGAEIEYKKQRVSGKNNEDDERQNQIIRNQFQQRPKKKGLLGKQIEQNRDRKRERRQNQEGEKEYPKSTKINQQKTNNRKQQQLIDPLELETYFFKMRKNHHQQHSKIGRQKFKIHPIPTKDEMSHFIRNYIPEFEEINIEELMKRDNFQIIQYQSNNKRSFYFGEVKDDKRNGKGIMIVQKSFFEGIWAQDKKVKGIEQTQTGKYKGQFKDGQRFGKGQFFWSHGQYYSGEWKNGKKNGSGYWKSPNGESYMGQWRNGQATGSGVHIMNQGQRYEGEFVNFLKHGFGYQQFPNGDRYEGLYSQGQAHGKGKYFWKNGTVFIGDFLDGFREGKGQLIAPNNLLFQGRFKKDSINGHGYLRYGNGDSYNGLFCDNKMNGFGVFQLKSQKKCLKGNWQNNQLIQITQ